MTTGHFDLDRFVRAQAATYAGAVAELTAGRKESHWMWFVFPQLVGLGRSERARVYGIVSLAEARAYLAHPVLGPRLVAATGATLPHAAQGAAALFGSPDDLKFRSSLTLFGRADGRADGPFRTALAAFFAGDEDPATLALLKRD
jgi:uncharacterized protein (DUF1810 family)